MKRFFLITASAAAISALIVTLLKEAVYVSIFCAIALLVILCIIKRYFKLKYAYSLLLFLLAFIMFVICFNNYVKKVESVQQISGSNCIVYGTLVTNATDHGDKYEYIFKPDNGSFKETNHSFKIAIYSKFKIEAEPYDRLKICLDVYNTNSNRKLSNYADNVLLNGKVRYCSVYKTKNKPIYYKIKQIFISRIKNNLPNVLFGIPIAVLTGDKTYLDTDLYRNVKSTGMAHVMAVSGMHISIICMSIVFVMNRLNVGRKLSAIIGLISLIILSGIAGFNGSILRAALMYVVMFLGEIFSRRADSLNSLCMAATILLYINPYTIFNLSFLLSYFGTLGIITISPIFIKAFIDNIKLPKIIKRIYAYIVNIIIISISAGVFILPISLFTFGYYSIISVVVNLIITLPIYLIILTSIIASFYIPIISSGCFILLKYSCMIFKIIIDYFANFNITVIHKDDAAIYLIFGLIILWILLLLIFKKKKILISIISITVAFSIGISVYHQTNVNKTTYRFIFFPSEIGNCTVIEHNDNVAVITSSADSNTLYNLKYYLNNRLQKNIDLLIIPTSDIKVLEKTINLTREYKIESIFTYNEETEQKSFSLDDVKINLLTSNENSAVKIKHNSDVILIDDTGYCSENANYIVTNNALISYKIHGNKAKYILNDEFNNSVYYSHYIQQNNGKTAILTNFGEIIAVKHGNNVLKLNR